MKPRCLPTYNQDHHDGDRFINDPREPHPDMDARPSLKNLLKFFVSFDVRRAIQHRSLVGHVENTETDRVFWIGHATNLIQLNGKSILTDPIFSGYASPIPRLIRRRTPLPLEIKDLPKISAIVISHCHWDHLDSKSIAQIAEKNHGVKVFAPLGCAALIASWGYPCEVVAFDWRQWVEFEGIRFTCMPARHASARYGWDANRTLWCSWLIESDKSSIYFPGDTAIGPHFQEVRDTAVRQIDLALMPIGPQEPDIVMRWNHLSPTEAHDMAVILAPRIVYPIHYGTFALGVNPAKPDIEVLKEVWTEDNLRVIPIGGYVEWKGDVFDVPDAGF